MKFYLCFTCNFMAEVCTEAPFQSLAGYRAAALIGHTYTATNYSCAVDISYILN